MKRFAPLINAALIALFIGFTAGWWRANSVSAQKLERVVAMSWGDGVYGPAFYGAHVFLAPADKGHAVRARVYIGRGNYFHDCGVLGTVQTDAEAVARWGTIVWREDGLYIGSGTNEYFMPRAKLERHR